MSRGLDTSMAAGLAAPLIMPVILVMITFRTSVKYCWSGTGTLVYEGNSYLGVGSLGKLGDIAEGVGVQAQGTSVTLSGIDPVLLGESMTDIKSGAPATVSIGLLGPSGAIIGAAYECFSGTVDVPTVKAGADTISITISLENKLVNLGRARQTRYTTSDQALTYSDDIGFLWVPILNDVALRWGS
jgi:hypothetical protein